jgi:outer membrane protein assembly factor BamA
MEVSQHRELTSLRQLRAVTVVCLAAVLPVALAAQEPQQRVVRQLNFVGNHALDELTLTSAIATTTSSAFATLPLLRLFGLGEKRYFDEVEFRRDVVRLVLLYRQSGYMNAVIDTTVKRDGQDANITFRIHEGEPVRVTSFDIDGVDKILNLESLRRDLPLQVGDPFNRFLFLASADTIVTRLRSAGYPYAEVLRGFDSDAEALRADLSLAALPGPRMLVGAVRIEGLQEIDTGTVRRMLSVSPGDVYRERNLFRSQRDLYGMDVFRLMSPGIRFVASLRNATQRPSSERIE